jgi:uncharacterized protein YkwD
LIVFGLTGYLRAIGQGDSAEILNLDQARQYMLELINRDRAATGLRRVEMDETATGMGQSHAEEMAVYAYLSHANREGKLPDQRYTEAGGRDRVVENVFLAGGSRSAAAPLTLVKDPVFRRRDLEAIQAAYFNQVPPYDSHRRNILHPHHTHVSIGLARAAGEGRQTASNTQEFVARYIQVEPIPADARIGDIVKVTGRVPGGLEFHSIDLARDDLPKPGTQKGGPYRTPRTFASYYPEHHEPDKLVTASADGKFVANVRLSEDDRPGVYYVRVRVRRLSGEKIVASQRTIVVRER